MKSFGITLFVLGVGSAALHFAGRNFYSLGWIDTWGEGVAWAIRAAFAVVGGVLWFRGRRDEKAAAQDTAKSS